MLDVAVARDTMKDEVRRHPDLAKQSFAFGSLQSAASTGGTERETNETTAARCGRHLTGMDDYRRHDVPAGEAHGGAGAGRPEVAR